MSGLDIKTGSETNEAIINLLSDRSVPIKKDVLDLMKETTQDQIEALESFTDDLEKVRGYIERLKVRCQLIDERLSKSDWR